MARTRVDVNTKGAVLKVESLQIKLRENPILSRIGLALKEWMDRNFRREGGISVDRSKWDPIAASTKQKDNWRAPLVRTGELKNSSFFKIEGGKLRAGYSDNKASFHHFGTRPHVITPRDADNLKFPNSAGEMIFTKRVNHPGTPKRSLLPSRTDVSRIAVREIRERLREDV